MLQISLERSRSVAHSIPLPNSVKAMYAKNLNGIYSHMQIGTRELMLI